MTIFERDKERGEGVVVTPPTTNDADAVDNRPAPKGKLIWTPSGYVAPPRHSYDYDSSSRLASGIHPSFQNFYYFGEGQ